MRVVTACTACHRIGDLGQGGTVSVLDDVGRPAVPGPQVRQLLGLEDVTPAAPVADADLLADDPERVQENRQPGGYASANPIPSGPGEPPVPRRALASRPGPS
jgi:hypothetical protein